MASFSPHVLGVDDGPFEKRQSEPVPIVGVMMECPRLLECVAIGSLPVDAANASEALGEWISGLRCYPSVRAVILGGISIAGLGLIDVPRLAERIRRAVLVVNRKDPSTSALGEALRAAGLTDRIEILERTPAAIRIREGLHLAWSGCAQREAEAILRASLGKAFAARAPARRAPDRASAGDGRIPGRSLRARVQRGRSAHRGALADSEDVAVQVLQGELPHRPRLLVSSSETMRAPESRRSA